MVDYSPYFNRPFVDRKGLSDNSVELRGLDVGKYYWRVAALDKDGGRGRVLGVRALHRFLRGTAAPMATARRRRS